MRSNKPLVPALILLPVSLAAHAQSNEYAGTPVSTTVYVPFANGSARFTPNVEGVALLGSAPAAAPVTIRGRTSTAKPTAKDEALALARAISARAYLIERGVSPLKITLNYVSAADFVAENSTVSGPELNQRVEIDIIHLANEEEY